ncbi:MAG: type II secretion system F family protein [Gammaproteobacteria bacterium]|nr:type II secretion system F family protein [Pseudomonadota bacterium]MCH9663025.1 type II secretion system F family protein [Gammaproteobacteria bacterium]
MPAFRYTAVNSAGDKVSGIIDAENEAHVRQELRGKGMFPTSIDLSRAVNQSDGSSALSDRLNALLSKSFDREQLALFTQQMAVLLKVGTPLVKAINLIAQYNDNPRTKSLLYTISSKVSEGYNLSSVLEEHPVEFNNMYTAAVAAGEASGTLDVIFARLSGFLERQGLMRQKMVQALIYPVLLIGFSFVVLSGLMIWVVPKILEVATASGQNLPVLTQILMTISDFVQANLTLLSAGTLGIVMFFILMIRQPKVMGYVMNMLMYTPVIRGILVEQNATRYTYSMSVLISSGQPLMQSMEIASRSLSVPSLRKDMIDAERKIREGTSFTIALTEANWMPPIALQLIASGENSGELSSMLEQTSEMLENGLSKRISVAMSLLEPIALITTGVLVLLIVLAVALPILNINQIVKT